MGLILRDHEGLHHAVARAALAGGAASVAGLFLPGHLAFGLFALAVSLAVVLPLTAEGRFSTGSALWALFWACAVAAVARAKLGGVGVAAGSLALGASLARGSIVASGGSWKRLGVTGLGALGAATAVMVAAAILITDLFAFLPAGLEALVAGALCGAIVGVSSIGRHLERADAPLEAELLADSGEGELGQLLRRAAAAYREAVEAIGEQAPDARAAADDLVRKMARFGKRWREVEAQAARTLPGDLRERLTQLDARIAATRDEVARHELTRAHEAVVAQLGSLEEIDRGRERAVARLTHQVATLERLRLAAVRHRSVDAARLGLELQPVVEELADAGGDLDLASDALAEAAQTAIAPPAVN